MRLSLYFMKPSDEYFYENKSNFQTRLNYIKYELEIFFSLEFFDYIDY